jgi:hypothetical protein
MSWACSTHGREMKCIQEFWWDKLKEDHLGRPGRRWDDNIEMGFKRTGL